MNILKTMKKSTRSNLITYGIVVLFYLVMQLLASGGVLSNSMQGMLVPICTYVVLAVSLNLTVGILGELSLGHAGFMSVGAFSGAVYWMIAGQNLPSALGLAVAMLIGGVMAGVFGFLIGIPVLRLRGDYLAIVTLAFGEIIKNILNAIYLGWDSNGFHFSMKDADSLNMGEDGEVIINGAIGISGMTKASSFTAGIILVLITLFVVLNLINSRAGRAIMSIRDNRIAAEAHRYQRDQVQADGVHHLCFPGRYGGRAVCTEYVRSGGQEVRLQYLHSGSGVRGSGRYRQHPRFCDRGSCSVCAA